MGITLQEKYGIKAEDEDMLPYMINNPQICPRGKLHHIILIVSDPQHFKTRNIFRKTWAQPDLLKDYPYRTVYLIGNSYDELIQKQIVAENEKYHDIVQADFVDSYHNITFKVLVGFKWIMKYCSNVTYVYRVNDDVFVDQVFIAMTLNKTYSGVKRSIMGNIYSGIPMRRDLAGRECKSLKGKVCIAPNDYPHLKTFPLYVHGGFYVLTRDILEDIYSTSLRITYQWIEDAFITGFVVKELGNIKFINWLSHITRTQSLFLLQYINGKRQYVATESTTFNVPWIASLMGYTKEEKKMLQNSYAKYMEITA